MSSTENRIQTMWTIYESLFSKLHKKVLPKAMPYGETIVTASTCLKNLSLNMRNHSLVDRKVYFEKFPGGFFYKICNSTQYILTLSSCVFHL